MSRITDAIDGAGEAPIELPTRPSGVVAESADRRDAALAVLAREGSLADALDAATRDLAELEVVGFAAVDAEPFAVARGATSDVVAAVRARLASPRDGGPAVLDVLWASHRGHAVWLHPAEGEPLALALRLAEELDASRSLARFPVALAHVADAAFASGDADLQALTTGARFEALLAAVEADATPASEIGEHDVVGLVLFGADGSAVVARPPTSAPLAIVDRAGRPWLLPLRATTTEGWLGRLHRAIDRDLSPAEVLGAGAVLDGDAAPVLLGAQVALGPSTSSQR